jgi:hypothetical protein
MKNFSDLAFAYENVATASARACRLKFLCANVNQQIVLKDSIFELRQLMKRPVAAQVSALGPISLAGAKPC